MLERDVLIPELQSALRRHGNHKWLASLAEIGVSAGPVNTIAEVFADPHVIERQLRVTLPHGRLGALPGVACPVRMSDSPPVLDRGPPALDEHGEEIRRGLKWQPNR